MQLLGGGSGPKRESVIKALEQFKAGKRDVNSAYLLIREVEQNDSDGIVLALE